jgi:hypothetical protein
MVTDMECKVPQVRWNENGTWRVVWPCGYEVLGISDYDLARTKRRHECQWIEKEPGQTHIQVG